MSGFLTKPSLFSFLIDFFVCLVVFCFLFFGVFLVGRRNESRILHLAASLVEFQYYCNLQKLQEIWRTLLPAAFLLSVYFGKWLQI